MIRATATYRPRSDAGQFVSVKVTPAVASCVLLAGQLVQQYAQRYAPVRTGALRESITVEIEEGAKTIMARVGPHVPYAEFVEFGTGRRGMESPGAGNGPYNPEWPGMVAQPYMRPALDEARMGVMDLFRSQLGMALNA